MDSKGTDQSVQMKAITISSDLRMNTHIVTFAHRTLGLLQRSLIMCPAEVKKNRLPRTGAVLKYACLVWDPQKEFKKS